MGFIFEHYILWQVQATGRWANAKMKSYGVTTEQFLRYHTSQMELHRYLLTIDQTSVGSKFVEHRGVLLPVPLKPERGVLVSCFSS